MPDLPGANPALAWTSANTIADIVAEYLTVDPSIAGSEVISRPAGDRLHIDYSNGAQVVLTFALRNKPGGPSFVVFNYPVPP